MFTYEPETRLYWFNPHTLELDGEYKLIGAILGLAIYNGVILDVHLPVGIGLLCDGVLLQQRGSERQTRDGNYQIASRFFMHRVRYGVRGRVLRSFSGWLCHYRIRFGFLLSPPSPCDVAQLVVYKKLLQKPVGLADVEGLSPVCL